MLSIIGIVFPLFAVIAVGYASVRAGWFKPSEMPILGRFVMQLALPALLFHAVASRDLHEVLDPGYIAIIVCGGLLTIAVAFAWFTLTAPDKRRRAMAVMGTVCPNSSFVGYPLIVTIYPDLAGVILAQNVLIENILLIPLTLIIVDLSENRSGVSPLRLLGKVLYDFARRPMIIALVAGLIFSVSGLHLPSPGDRFLTLLSGAASAMALVVIGGSLVGLPLTGNRAMAMQIAVSKLLVHPLIVFATASVLVGAGVITISHEMQVGAILSTAMPMFALYTVFAQERGLGGAASLALLAATSCSFFTLSFFLWWLT
ncbi:AEC family transporter [Albibacillus kandeliae]|uniref:AEC family transporter n=1 Tax=Albibacillus kandeliae TaxID=2174228 RepID=UPI000D695F3F|nr:AEC family transporter [Albibacillus kandeliae]